MVHLRLSEDLKEWLDAKAEREDRTKTVVVNRILREAKERDEQERKP